MYREKNDVIKERRIKLRHSYRTLSAETVKYDPDGKGLSKSSCVRADTTVSGLSFKNVLILCNALGMSPANLYEKYEVKE